METSCSCPGRNRRTVSILVFPLFPAWYTRLGRFHHVFYMGRRELVPAWVMEGLVVACRDPWVNLWVEITHSPGR